MEFLKEKNIKDYSGKVKRIFNLMSIAGEYRVIGSASLKKIKYFSDYDLDELYKQSQCLGDSIYTKIYKSFKNKFIEARKDPNIFITDFKCGMDSNLEALRWSYDDIMKGYKIMEDGSKISFEDCLNIKTTIKLDVVAIIEGVFTEFSENYYFKFGKNKGNFFEYDIDKDNILNKLKHSYDEYMYVEKNYLKALKRIFAYKELKNKVKYRSQLEKLMDFFNSEIGLLNKYRSELDIIIILLENKYKFRKVKNSDIKYNLEYMMDKLNNENINFLNEEFEKIIKKEKIGKTEIEDLRNQIYNFVNKKTLDFILKNKNLLLY
jgi:hypothetical protein